ENSVFINAREQDGARTVDLAESEPHRVRAVREVSGDGYSGFGEGCQHPVRIIAQGRDVAPFQIQLVGEHSRGEKAAIPRDTKTLVSGSIIQDLQGCIIEVVFADRFAGG